MGSSEQILGAPGSIPSSKWLITHIQLGYILYNTVYKCYIMLYIIYIIYISYHIISYHIILYYIILWFLNTYDSWMHLQKRFFSSNSGSWCLGTSRSTVPIPSAPWSRWAFRSKLRSRWVRFIAPGGSLAPLVSCWKPGDMENHRFHLIIMGLCWDYTG